MKPFASLPAEHQRILRHALKSVDEPLSEVSVSDRDGKGLGVWAPARGNDEYIVRHDASGKTITAKDGEQVELPPETVSQHTPEKWVVRHTRTQIDGRIEDTYSVGDSGMFTEKEEAERAVACVNACKDMENPAEEIAKMRERVAALELEVTTQRVISSEMHKIAELVRTQDNRMTSHPIFMVQEKRGQKWVNVQPCFTEEGANRYIRMDGHNLREPRVYVASGYRNLEWQLIRTFFISLKKSNPSSDSFNADLLKDVAALTQPNYRELNRHAGRNDRLLHAVLCAYAKHNLDCPDIGWNQLGEMLLNVICNEIGDDAFVAWGERITEGQR